MTFIDFMYRLTTWQVIWVWVTIILLVFVARAFIFRPITKRLDEIIVFVKASTVLQNHILEIMDPSQKKQ